VAPVSVRTLGEFIADQRRSRQMSVRQLASRAGVSNPYVSQIERGLRRPSAQILQRLAGALRISSEALFVQAGLLDEPLRVDTRTALSHDPHLTETQRRRLLRMYDDYLTENLPGNGQRRPPLARTREESTACP
jgi:transcriptional regulator with XRE-family HTH domain